MESWRGGGRGKGRGGKEPVLFVNEKVPEIRFRSKKGIETNQKLQYRFLSGSSRFVFDHRLQVNWGEICLYA